MGHIKDQEDLISAIHYYEKAALFIEETNNYPDGATVDMYEIEYYTYTSYYVFSTIPALYSYGYNRAIEEVANSSEILSYVDTLDVLPKNA